MKTKFQFLLWLFAIVPLAFISCGDDETIIEDTTLETSVASVTFTKDGGDQSITITTNAAKWIASSPVEGAWLTLTANGDQLSVKAAANQEGVDRKSYILINAGNTAAKVEVMQSAGDATLFLGTESLSFLNVNAESRVDVVSSGDITVEADADWIGVDYQPGADFFTIGVTPTSGTEARAGKVIVTCGTAIKEIAVNQDVVVLPFFGKSNESSIMKMMEFEEARGCKVMTLPDGLFNTAYYYMSPDPNFPQLGYAGDITGDYSQGITATANLELENAIIAAIEKNGFVLSGGVYTHEVYPYALSVTKASDGITVLSTYNPIQDKAYPTFETLPMKEPQMGWTPCVEVGVHGAKYEEVVAPWEAENAGTFVEAMSTYPATGDFAWFDMSEEVRKAGLYARSYWIYHDQGDMPVSPDYEYFGELSSARAIYSNVELAYWTPDGSQYFMTKEFTSLLEQEGFVYLQSSQGYEFYVLPNEEKGYWDVLAFGPAAFTDVLDGQPIIDIQTFKWQIQATSVASVITNKDLLVKTITGMTKVLLRNEKSQTIHRIK